VWLLLRQVNFKRVSLGVLIVVVLALAAAVKIQSDQLATAKEVYRNPRVVTIVKTVKVAGPIRIKTVIRETPAGERTTEIVEDRAATVETTDAKHELTPVPLAIALASPNPDKWLAGVGNRNFSYRTIDTYSVWAGREFGPFVVEAGAGYRSFETVLLVKFGK
jgi:hypothetical protein